MESRTEAFSTICQKCGTEYRGVTEMFTIRVNAQPFHTNRTYGPFCKECYVDGITLTNGGLIRDRTRNV